MVFWSRSWRLVVGKNPILTNLLVRIWHRNTTIEIVVYYRIQLSIIIIRTYSLSLLDILIILKHLAAYQLIGMITKWRPGHLHISISLLHVLVFIEHQRFVVCRSCFELLMRHEQIILFHLTSSIVAQHLWFISWVGSMSFSFIYVWIVFRMWDWSLAL